MADGLVLDTSAALAIVLAEPEAPAVRERLLAAVGGPILVLELFWLEVVNILARRHGWEADAVVAAIRDLDELGLETVTADRPLVLAALDLVVTHGLSAYDAAHLVLAEAADVPLLTLDARLARAAGARAAIRPLPAAGEAPAPYGTGQPAPDWTRHGRYLAELRLVAATG
jgi:predicted nucleic acid-binding protein